jgi:hypothetical protein
MKCLYIFDLQLYFCLKKLSTETDLLFIGKIDFLKIINFNFLGGEGCKGGGGCLPLQKVGDVPPGLTPLLIIVKRFHKGNAHGGRPTVIKVRK